MNVNGAESCGAPYCELPISRNLPALFCEMYFIVKLPLGFTSDVNGNIAEADSATFGAPAIEIEGRGSSMDTSALAPLLFASM